MFSSIFFHLDVVVQMDIFYTHITINALMTMNVKKILVLEATVITHPEVIDVVVQTVTNSITSITSAFK